LPQITTSSHTLIHLVTVCGSAIFLLACSQTDNPKTTTQSSQVIDVKSESNLFKKTNKSYLSESEKAYLEKGLKLPELSIEDRRDLARRLSNESGRAEDNKNYDQMRYFIEKAHNIRENIALDYPENYLDRMSLFTSLASLAKLEQTLGNSELAQKHYEESLSGLEGNPPSSEYKSLWKRLVMWRYRDLGDLKKGLKQYDDAKAYYEKYLEAVISNPAHDDYFYDYSEAYFFLGELAFSQSNWREAVTHYESYFSLLEKVENIKNHRDILHIDQRNAIAYGKLGHAAYVLSQHDKSETAFASLINIRQNFYEKNSTDVDIKLNLALNLKYVAERSHSSKAEYYERALELFQELQSDGDLPDIHLSVIDEIKANL